MLSLQLGQVSVELIDLGQTASSVFWLLPAEFRPPRTGQTGVAGPTQGGGALHPQIHPWADAKLAPISDTGHMTTTGYLMNIALIALVVLQIRGHKVTRARLVFPLAATVFVAAQFLHSIPTSGNDLVLIVGSATTGVALGAGAGLLTTVRRDGPSAFAKAGLVAAVLWIVGIGARMGFALWVGHGGQAAVAQFSVQHHISSGAAWGAAFVLMAMAEVASRTGVLYVKTLRSGATIERGGLFRAPAAV